MMRCGLTRVRTVADERSVCDHSASPSAIATALYRISRSTPRGHTVITALQWQQWYRRTATPPTRASLR